MSRCKAPGHGRKGAGSDAMPHPDVRLDVTALVALAVDRHGHEGAGDDVVAALREGHPGPLLPRGDRSADVERARREREHLGAEPVMEPDPGVEGEPVRPLPAHVALERREW